MPVLENRNFIQEQGWSRIHKTNLGTEVIEPLPKRKVLFQSHHSEKRKDKVKSFKMQTNTHLSQILKCIYNGSNHIPVSLNLYITIPDEMLYSPPESYI